MDAPTTQETQNVGDLWEKRGRARINKKTIAETRKPEGSLEQLRVRCDEMGKKTRAGASNRLENLGPRGL